MKNKQRFPRHRARIVSFEIFQNSGTFIIVPFEVGHGFKDGFFGERAAELYGEKVYGVGN